MYLSLLHLRTSFGPDGSATTDVLDVPSAHNNMDNNMDSSNQLPSLRRDSKRNDKPKNVISGGGSGPPPPKGGRGGRQGQQQRKQQPKQVQSVTTLPDQKPYAPNPLLTLFSPKTFPVYETKPNNNDDILAMVLANQRHQHGYVARFLADGIKRSNYLSFVGGLLLGSNDQVYLYRNKQVSLEDTSVKPLLLVLDFAGLHHDCHSAVTLIRSALLLNKNAVDVKLLVVDYSGSWETVHCPAFENLVGKRNVRIAKRSIVQGRYWDETKEWVEPGTIVTENEGRQLSGGPIVLMPHTVREAFVDQVRRMMHQRKHIQPYDGKKLNDVAHFWKRGSNSHYSFLRKEVSEVVSELHGRFVGDRQIDVLVQNIGNHTHREQNLVDPLYVDQMLSSKIIVVAQRDEYEDHLRLWESLACGAMVMTDPVLSLHASLRDREHLVIYHNADDLKQKLLYYLDPAHDEERARIARKGWEVAMGQHRSWHRLEEILFGIPKTSYKRPYEVSKSFVSPVVPPPASANTNNNIDNDNNQSNADTDTKGDAVAQS